MARRAHSTIHQASLAVMVLILSMVSYALGETTRHILRADETNLLEDGAEQSCRNGMARRGSGCLVAHTGAWAS